MWDTSRLLSTVGSVEPLGSVNGGVFDELNNCQHLMNGFSALFAYLFLCSGSVRVSENRNGSVAVLAGTCTASGSSNNRVPVFVYLKTHSVCDYCASEFVCKIPAVRDKVLPQQL
jgi:hypothetical protein